MLPNYKKLALILFSTFIIVAADAQIQYNNDTPDPRVPTEIKIGNVEGNSNSYFSVDLIKSSHNGDASGGISIGESGSLTERFWINHQLYDNHQPVKKLFIQYPATGIKHTFTHDGKVGFGTENPGATLHVFNGNNSYGTILANANESSFSLYAKTLTTQPINVESFRLGLKYNADENNGFISFYRGASTNGGFLGFSTNGQERIRVATNGNVGIGTNTPSTKLDVNGALKAGELIVNKTATSNRYPLIANVVYSGPNESGGKGGTATFSFGE